MEIKNLPILKWALIIGIVVVLNLFFNFGIKTFYGNPEWDEFCPREQVTVQPTTQEACVAQGGAWTEAGYTIERYPVPAKPLPLGEEATGLPAQTGYCDLYFTCQQEFEAVNEVYNRNVFIALVILGLISVVAGFLTTARSAVSLGLTFGGVLSFIIGSVRYWSDMDEYLRVIILGVALVVLIWLGVKKVRE
jgi:hypothetical protein